MFLDQMKMTTTKEHMGTTKVQFERQWFRPEKAMIS